MHGRNCVVTNHFKARQVERSVPQKLIDSVLNHISRTKRKTMVIISRKILRDYGINMRKDLFLVIDGPVLITCYYRDFQEFILTSHQTTEYLIINNIKQ